MITTGGLLTLLVQLAILGVIVYAVHYFLEMITLPQPVKMIIYFILGLVGLVFLLRLLGIAI